MESTYIRKTHATLPGFYASRWAIVRILWHPAQATTKGLQRSPVGAPSLCSACIVREKDISDTMILHGTTKPISNIIEPHCWQSSFVPKHGWTHVAVTVASGVGAVRLGVPKCSRRRARYVIVEPVGSVGKSCHGETDFRQENLVPKG